MLALPGRLPRFAGICFRCRPRRPSSLGVLAHRALVRRRPRQFLSARFRFIEMTVSMASPLDPAESLGDKCQLRSIGRRRAAELTVEPVLQYFERRAAFNAHLPRCRPKALMSCAFDSKDSHLPSGDQASGTSGVSLWVRRLVSPVPIVSTQLSPAPVRVEVKANCLPSGECSGRDYVAGCETSSRASPPFVGRVQISPPEIKAISDLSGEIAGSARALRGDTAAPRKQGEQDEPEHCDCENEEGSK